MFLFSDGFEPSTICFHNRTPLNTLLRSSPFLPVDGIAVYALGYKLQRLGTLIDGDCDITSASAPFQNNLSVNYPPNIIGFAKSATVPGNFESAFANIEYWDNAIHDDFTFVEFLKELVKAGKDVLALDEK